MKFIGGIQNFRIDNNSTSIRLLNYHRAATGLLSGAEVYVFPKISTITNATGQETQVREIIISPFHPNDWYNIYELELNMHDQPGMINSITSILLDKSINIHIQESLITNDEQNFSVNLIVDVREYRRSFTENESIEQEMFSTLSKSFLEINILLEKFLPCKQLRNNSNESQKKKRTNHVEQAVLQGFYTSHYHPIQIVNKQLLIGKQVIQTLFPDSEANLELQGTIFSDTNEKMIIVRFFNREQYIVYFDIQHDNKLGAIFTYSSLIKDTSDSYNIISCYNRVENTTETAHWYVLLDVSHDIDKLHVLFNNLTNPATKFVQKLIVHKYSRNIEFLNIKNLNQYFPSQANLAHEKKKNEIYIAHESKYWEVMAEIGKMKTEFSNETSLLKDKIVRNNVIVRKARAQFWIVSFIIIAVCSYVIIKIVPPSDFNKAWVQFIAIGGGLLTVAMALVHIFVVYKELPKTISGFFRSKKKNDKKKE